jgi:tetratricopeptide (TPR) repeat protein
MGIDRAAVVRKADEFVSQGKLDLAIAEYRALLDEQPADMGAANTLGDLYARAGDTARAIEQFTRLAESERAQGFTPKAIALYKKALKVDPCCEEALSQLAEIAVAQELLADATLYWNRLVQHRREREDAPGVAQALMRLASLAVAKADTKLAAARAAEPHVDAVETARLYATAAEALAREGRDTDALDAWVEAARRTDDVAVRRAAALACLAGGVLDRAEPFLSVEAAGDEPALLWAVGERAAEAGDEAVAMRALGRYRTLVPDDASRASALLAQWESPAAPVIDSANSEDAWHLAGSGEVDLAVLLADASVDAPVPAYEQVARDAEADLEGAASQETPVEVVRFEEVPSEVAVATVIEDAAPADAWHAEESEEVDLAILLADAPADVTAPAARLEVVEEPPGDEPVVQPAVPPPYEPVSDEADLEVDEAATIAQLQAAADTPALQFQAAAHLGRLFMQRGQLDLGVEWLERACAVPAPVREHGLAARYDLADALERAGQQDRALACWSDLEFDAGSYRDVADRLARLTRTLG